ncbi:bifunctional 2-C-methyl-D-erythritol 4-phosphate cytidylyltransferase/2-C-methyl-D-erythritol 2,4-cyclodiphosphate synthase [Chelativorans alearense]|uniref:bifunctional 2-C-methyl-D-erythritol 4-phosphate cytidylyltransferase/2-C-methyl-D-erythritol 2,4-cyclodiphosphate synthase n=1 Tax=Chelativorans alearense TaxID=2681495 RepID=UPI0013D183CD|nr:bifunctional 2-C-methyl-D-erythritol 4-phosphate cytidylyltransferase/2-C-methyl-D-erythritol 2,4-cyclodiphosphate synthase [Chelativorans alearense]
MNALLEQGKAAAKRRIAAVIVAAGRGERAGQNGNGPKQYRPIGGKSVIRYTLETFAAHERIDTIAVAIHPEDSTLFAAACEGIDGDIRAIPGGPSRQESTRLALAALAEVEPDIVLIHDGVRPFIDGALIDRVIDAVADGTGALPAVAISDTLKRSGADMLVKGTVPRADLFAAQTPQGFSFPTILAAHEKALKEGRLDFTDDAAIAEWAGIPVRLVEGSPDNTKLTWARDMALADQRLSAMRMPDVRTGNGYDVHAFGKGDRVWLCGVEIAHEKALQGHSDADVGLHALTDALLATCGAGDIGTHFPPSDPQWKGARSRLFVEHAVKLVRGRGGRIANADITLICEAPRVGPHREAMVAELSDMLRIAPERVSVKATTNEKLGFLGREEGIAAIATATVVYPDFLPE